MSTYSLDGQWRFRCPHELRGSAPSSLGLKRWMPATMPGTIHHALHVLGKIDDPHDARNELDVQWIDQQDWELSSTVEVTTRRLPKSAPRARLRRARYGRHHLPQWEEGRPVGEHVPAGRVRCRRRSQTGNNEIRILFESPTAYTAREAKRYANRKSKRPEFVWQTGERRRHDREWIRKVQCHFGWDWGLFLATSGIWQPARLECSDAPRIAAVKTRQTHRVARGGNPEKPSAVELSITTYLDLAFASNGSAVDPLRWRDDRPASAPRPRRERDRSQADASIRPSCGGPPVKASSGSTIC